MLRFSAALSCVFAAVEAGKTAPNYNVLLANAKMDDDVILLDDLNMLQDALLDSMGFFVARGTTLKFAAYSNPTTGFSWVVNRPNFGRRSELFTITDEYVADPPPDGADGWAGGGGYHYFNIEAGNRKGDGYFWIEYKKEWEVDVLPEKFYFYPVHVF